MSLKNVFKKYLSVLVAVFMVLGMVSKEGMSQRVRAEGEKSLVEISDKLTVTATTNTSNLVRNGSLTVKIDYHLDPSEAKNAGNVWVYDLSSLVGNSPVKDLTSGIGDIVATEGTVGSYEIKDNKVYLTITDQKWLNDKVNVDDPNVSGYFNLDISLDSSEMNESSQYDLVFPGKPDSTIHVDVKEASISTSKGAGDGIWHYGVSSQNGSGASGTLGATDNGDGTYTLYYKLECTPTANLTNLTLNDVLGSGQSIKSGSIKINYNETDYTDISSLDNLNIASKVGGKVEAGKKVTVTYKTVLSATEIDALGENGEVTNSASWSWSGGTTTDTTNVHPEKAKKSYSITKATSDSDTGYDPDESITYTITLNSGETKVNMAGHTITDHMDLDLGKLVGDIVITDSAGNSVSGVTITPNEKAKDDTYSTTGYDVFSFTFPEGTYNDTYTITYTMKLADKDTANAQGVYGTLTDKNTATDTDKDGSGTASTWGSVDYGTKPADPDDDFKKLNSIDTVNDTLTFDIEVNVPEGEEWNQVWVTDSQARYGTESGNLSKVMDYTYATVVVKERDTDKELSEGEDFTLSRESEQLNVVFEKLNKSVIISITFNLKDGDEIDNDKGELYYSNSATIAHDSVRKTDKDEGHWIDTNIKMSKNVQINDDDTYTWTVNINPAKLKFEDDYKAFFTDILPEGMELVGTTIHVVADGDDSKGGQWHGGVNFDPEVTTTYDGSKDQYTIEPVEISSFNWNGRSGIEGNPDAGVYGMSGMNFVVTYRTKLTAKQKTVVKAQAAQGKVKTTYHNIAIAQDEDGGHQKQAEADVEHEYKAVEKKDVTQSTRTDDAILYEVVANPDKTELNGGENIILSDVLATNVTLDLSSVKVVDENGADITGAKVGYSDDSRELEITIPDKTYAKISFTVRANKTGTDTFRNTITLSAKTNYSSSTEESHEIKNHSAGIKGDSSTIRIKKFDKYDLKKSLKDAKFKLYKIEYNESTGVITGETEFSSEESDGLYTTDPNGLAVFKNISPYHVYAWEEVEAPDGYSITSPGKHYFVTYNEEDGADGYNRAKRIDNLVQDNNAGVIVSTMTGGGNWNVDNLKDSSATYKVKLNKKLTGKDMEADQFTFELSAVSNTAEGNIPNPMPTPTTANNKAATDGVTDAIEFNTITFTQPGVYIYKIKESIPNPVPDGYVYDKSEYQVVISVIRNEDTGDLEIQTAKYKKIKDASGNDVSNSTESDDPAEFENKYEVGKLRIKKNVKVNGQETTGTEADGEYEFTITNKTTGASKTAKITIKNGKSDTVTVEDLLPGEYTVTETETNNLVAEVSSKDETVEVNTTKEVEFTNNKTTTGKLKVNKSVTVNGETPTGELQNMADGTYTFNVYSPTDTGKTTPLGTLTVEIKDGVAKDSNEISLVAGTYILSEVSPTNGTYTTNNDREITIVAGETSLVTENFVNNIQLGSLKIKKNVTINGVTPTGTTENLADGTYTFNVKSEDGSYNENFDITISGGQSKECQIDNLKPGKYTITETSTNGMTLTSSTNTTITIPMSGQATIETAEFTNNKDVTGGLVITKSVQVNKAEPTDDTKSLVDGTYKFKVTGPDGYEQTKEITISNGEAGQLFVDELVAGEYTIEELDAGNGTSVLGTNPITITVKGNETASNADKAEFVNNIDTGSLKVSKSVTVNGKTPEGTTLDKADGTYTFTIKNDEFNYSKDITITVEKGVSDPAQVDDLRPGTYTITEKTPDNGATLTSANDVQIEVKAGNTTEIPTATFINNKDVDGAIKVTKKVTVNGEATTSTLADGTYKFSVKDASDEEHGPITLTITNGQAQSNVLEGLPAGTYTVTEETPTNGTSVVGDSVQSVEVKGGETSETAQEITFTNNLDTGSLKIKKNVKVNGKDASTDKEKEEVNLTYGFTIAPEDDPTNTKPYSVTVSNGKDGEVIIEDLPVGKYIVTETDNKGLNLIEPASSTSITIEVTKEGTTIPTAEFTNDKTLTGGFKVQKEVTVDNTTPTETNKTFADGTYQFIVTDSSGNEKGNISLTIENGETKTSDFIGGLVPGEYTITEQTTDNGTTPTGGYTQKITVVGGETSTTASIVKFTNNIDTGSLEIKKNVQVNRHAPTTDEEKAEVNGTYHFEIKQGETVIKDDVTVTVENGVSGTTTVSGLKPGEYTVNELTDQNPDGMALMTENGQTVEVVGGNTTSVPTAEFTNSKEVVGSLKIKKNYTINEADVTDSNKSLADGTYYFTVKNSDGEVKADDVKIEIKNGETAYSDEIANLVPGEYTVTEKETSDGTRLIQGQDGVTVTVVGHKTGEEAVVAEFTNNKDLGSLEITKNVTVNGEATTGTEADGTYTFEVKKGNEPVDTVSITIKDGKRSVGQLDNLEEGDYTITETGNNNLVVDEPSKTVHVNVGKTAEAATVSFTNDKTLQGSLRITKKVTIDGDEVTDTTEKKTLADGTYHFVVKKDDKVVREDVTITIENGKATTTEVKGLVPGKYTVTELDPTNGTELSSESSVEVEVVGDVTGDAAQVAEFTNNKKTSSLKITKAVQVNDKDTTSTEADGTYTFRVLDSNDKQVANVGIQINEGKANSVTLDKLEPGSYKVKEVSKPDGMTVDKEEQEVVLEKGETGEVRFVNNKTLLGGLNITKKVTVNGKATQTNLADGDYVFEVKDSAGNLKKNVTITIENGEATTQFVKDLLPDTYTITEKATNNGTTLTSGNDVQVEVKGNETTDTALEASFTNNINVGSLKLKKTVKGIDSAKESYTFIVKKDDLYVNEDGTLTADKATITVNANDSVTIDNLPIGQYSVSEDQTEIGIKDYGVEVTGEGEVEITADQVATKEITNTYTKDLGSLKVVKEVTGLPDDQLNNTFKVSIQNSAGEYLNLDGTTSTEEVLLDISKDSPIEITKIPVGAYTIKEDTSDITVQYYAFKDSSVTEGSETVKKEDTVTFTLKNDYEQEKGELTVSKKLDGGNSNKEFKFKVTFDPALNGTYEGTEIKDGVVEFTLKDGQSKTIKGIPAGTKYEVEELDVPSGYKESYDNSKKGTITTTSSKTEVKNTYSTESAQAHLEAKKTLKNRNSKALEDGEFSFEFKADGDAPVPTNTSATNDANGKVVFDDIIFDEEGVYNYAITETSTDGNGVTVDTSTKNATITVKDNGEGKLVATVEYKDGETPEFVNTYDANGVAQIEVTKEFDYWENVEDQTFTFELTGDATDEAIATYREQTAQFKKLEYKLSQLEGKTSKTFNYVIKEKAPNESGVDKGITYDTKPHNVTVTVTDKGEGKLETEVKYDETEDSLTVKNTYDASTKIVLEAEKDFDYWDAKDAKEGFTFELTTGSDASEETLSTATVTESDEVGQFDAITYGMSDIDKTYTYYISEKLPEGVNKENPTLNGITYDTKKHKVEVTITDNHDGTLTATPTYEDGERAVINNTYEAKDTYKLEGTKVLKGRDLEENEFTFEITHTYGDDSKTETVQNDDKGNWVSSTYNFDLSTLGTHTFEVKEVSGDLDRVEYDDTVYKVTVEVKDNHDGTLSVTADKEKSDLVFTNYYKGYTDVSVKKVWDDKKNQDGIRPDSIDVVLKADGKEKETATLDASNEWSYTFKDLEKYNKGEEIQYTIEEVVVEGYESKITGDAKDGYTITNKHVPGTVEVSGEKTWKDNDNQDGIRPKSITVKLYADGEEVDSIDVTKDDNWKYAFHNLDKKKDGKDIKYTVDEVVVEGYDTDIDGYDITNTHKPEKTEVKGTKTWDDNDNQDGVRPESITVRLLADGQEVDKVKVTEDDNWAYAFTDLDKYSKGKEITYTIEEEKVEGYDTSIKGYDITNTHKPEKTKVKLTKTWDDKDNQDGLRPDSITVRLLADGKEIDTVEVTEADDWTYTFSNLDKYKDGKEISYTVTEDLVESYETSIDGYDITNTYTPDITNITVNKKWDDSNDKDHIRPDSITVILYRNGVEVKEVKVKKDMNWTYTFDNLAKYENGKEITYTIGEKEVKGYETSIDGYTITNTHTPPRTPRTSDDSNILEYLGLSISSFLLFILMIIKRRLEY